MNPARPRLFWIGLFGFASLTACTSPPPSVSCSAADISAAQLVGQWQVELSGHSTPWTLLLQPHPEHPGSLRGTLMQNPQHAAVVADVDDGEFTMEESRDGQRIAATWQGRFSPGSCGLRIQGDRLDSAPGQAPQRFQMRFSLRR